MKQRESVKLKESTNSVKKEPTDHRQSQYSPSSLALFATDSLELNWLEQALTNTQFTHGHIIIRIKMVILNTERRTKTYSEIQYANNYFCNCLQTLSSTEQFWY